jgi:cytochrome c oxidase assembly protein subunit 15
MSAMTNTAAPLAERNRELRNRTLVRGWLYLVLLVLFALVMVGGATRMTGSGLSITEWKPIHGVIPPLNQAEWQEEFEKYRQIPQYEQINKGMTRRRVQGHLLVGVGASAAGARRRLPRRHPARPSSGSPGGLESGG